MGDENQSSSSSSSSENSRPVWHDFIRLLYRECCIAAGLVLTLLKLKYGYTINFLDWSLVTIPFLVTAGIGFLVGIFELRNDIRYASDQFCSLEEMLGQQQRRGKGGKKA